MDTHSSIAQKIRDQGVVLDVAAAMSLYAPLLREQPRDGVTVIRDQAYGDDARHRLDVYKPDSLAAPAPVLVFMHGGAFKFGDKSMRDNVGYHFARAGLITVIPNYRLAPAHQWPSGAQDVVAVHQWLQQHAATHGGAVDKIFLMGESAGAAHVALATLVRALQPSQGLSIAGAILVSGVYNVQLETLAHQQFDLDLPDARNAAYFGDEVARYPQRSTVELIDVAPFPLLITFAELDLLQFQVQAGELFARLVTQHGFKPQIKMIRGHNHISQVQAINTGDEALSGAVLEFVRSRC